MLGAYEWSFKVNKMKVLFDLKYFSITGSIMIASVPGIKFQDISLFKLVNSRENYEPGLWRTEYFIPDELLWRGLKQSYLKIVAEFCSVHNHNQSNNEQQQTIMFHLLSAHCRKERAPHCRLSSLEGLKTTFLWVQATRKMPRLCHLSSFDTSRPFPPLSFFSSHSYLFLGQSQLLPIVSPKFLEGRKSLRTGFCFSQLPRALVSYV